MAIQPLSITFVDRYGILEVDGNICSILAKRISQSFLPVVAAFGIFYHAYQATKAYLRGEGTQHVFSHLVAGLTDAAIVIATVAILVFFYYFNLICDFVIAHSVIILKDWGMMPYMFRSIL